MNNCERLTETVNRFSWFIATLPADALAEQEWGPKGVLMGTKTEKEKYGFANPECQWPNTQCRGQP
jgi:hypothetical protein